MDSTSTIHLQSESAGHELKLLRQRKEITVGRIAFVLDISRSSVHRYERGMRSIPSNILVRWADYLGYDTQFAAKTFSRRDQ